MNITEEWQKDEWIKCAQSFKYFAGTYLEIRSLKEGDVKFKLYAFQERVLSEFERYQFNIVRKFRQGGLTTLAVLWSLWQCMFRESKQILVISKTDLEAIKAGKVVKRSLDIIRENHPWLYPRLSQDSAHILSFADTRSEVEFGSANRARGQALNYVIIDEAAFIPQMEDAWAAMYPTVSTGGNVLVISTVNGIGNWYERMYRDAEAERNDFNVVNLHYTEHPHYTDTEWQRSTKANLGPRKWAQEFEGSFLDSGDTYLSAEVLSYADQETRNKRIIKRLFAEWDSDERLFELHAENDSPELHTWDKGALWVWQEPKDGHEYVIGADVAEGMGDEGDSSTFQVFDMGTLEQVAEFASNTVPPNVFATILSRMGVYYNTALVAVESAGPGLAILDKLEHNLYYENIYFHRTKTQEKAGVIMSKATRPVILESMQNYMQNRMAKLCSTRLVRELETFIFDRSKKRAEARKGRHDDLVMAFAIALYARDKQIRQIPMGLEVPINIADSYATRTYEKIRKEIEESGPENLLKKEDSDLEPWEREEVLPGIIMPFERPRDDLLREFGW